MDWLLLAASGALAGFLSGLLGIGGGLIVVSGLLLVLPRFGVQEPETVTIAMATSMAAVLFTPISGAQGHLVNRAVDWIAVHRLAPGLVLGALAATQLTAIIDPALLMAVFTAFPLIAAWNILRGGRRTAKLTPLPHASMLSAPMPRHRLCSSRSSPEISRADLVISRRKHAPFTHAATTESKLARVEHSVAVLDPPGVACWARAELSPVLYP